LSHILAVVQVHGCSILELVYKASVGAVPFIQAALERYFAWHRHTYCIFCLLYMYMYMFSLHEFDIIETRIWWHYSGVIFFSNLPTVLIFLVLISSTLLLFCDSRCMAYDVIISYHCLACTISVYSSICCQ